MGEASQLEDRGFSVRLHQAGWRRVRGDGERGAQVLGVQDVAFQRDAAGAQAVGEARGEGYVEADLPQLVHVPEDLGRGSVQDDASLVHDDDPLEEDGLVHGVGDVQDAHALPAAQVRDRGDQAPGDGDREAARSARPGSGTWGASPGRRLSRPSASAPVRGLRSAARRCPRGRAYASDDCTLSEISSRWSPRFSGPKATSSTTRFITSWSSGSWKTTETLRRTSHWCSLSTGTPSIRMLPSVGYRTAVSSLTSVLLPEPLWPMIATSWPGSIFRFRSAERRHRVGLARPVGERDVVEFDHRACIAATSSGALRRTRSSGAVVRPLRKSITPLTTTTVTTAARTASAMACGRMAATSGERQVAPQQARPAPATPTVLANEPSRPAATEARSTLQRRRPTKTAHATTPISSRGRMARSGVS